MITNNKFNCSQSWLKN